MDWWYRNNSYITKKQDPRLCQTRSYPFNTPYTFPSHPPSYPPTFSPTHLPTHRPPSRATDKKEGKRRKGKGTNEIDRDRQNSHPLSCSFPLRFLLHAFPAATPHDHRFSYHNPSSSPLSSFSSFSLVVPPVPSLPLPLSTPSPTHRRRHRYNKPPPISSRVPFPPENRFGGYVRERGLYSKEESGTSFSNLRETHRTGLSAGSLIQKHRTSGPLLST